MTAWKKAKWVSFAAGFGRRATFREKARIKDADGTWWTIGIEDSATGNGWRARVETACCGCGEVRGDGFPCHKLQCPCEMETDIPPEIRQRTEEIHEKFRHSDGLEIRQPKTAVPI